MNLPELFESPAAFQEAFVAGLERQLAEPGLGAFILVLANASFDAAIWPALRAPLGARFAVLSEEVRSALRTGDRLDYPEDDLLVFLKLMAMGIEAIRPTEYRQVGPWEMQFTPMRALRPTRASGVKTLGSKPPEFNRSGFHFNKPFLQKEVLWQGDLLHRPCRLLYNKFPFAPWHGLLVPEPEREHPQRLTQELHLHAWHVTRALGTRLPGFGLSYNSFGAYASVNHLHFQTYLRSTPLPIEAAGWRHNGGETAYPADCIAFDDALEAWLHLARLHENETPCNLIYVPERLYCLPRRPQGGYDLPAWCGGQAWYEMAGGGVAFSQAEYRALSEAAIAGALGNSRLT
jgi:hypothetical protein